MGRLARHRTIDRIRLYTEPFPVHAEPAGREARLAQGVRLTLEGRRLRRVLRIPLRARRRQWRESRPVANQRHRSPVGQRIAPYLELEVQRASRLQDQQRRQGLVGMEHGRPVLNLLGEKDGAPKGSVEQIARGNRTS